jgi:hypothetical protein
MGIPFKKTSSARIGAVGTLLFALCISAVAAYYSIAGLMAIFAGAAVSIAVMGGVLEVGKLVAASWLYNNWSDAPRLLKGYLTASVVVLMFITSMGIFGYLSKAHLEQVQPGGDFSAKIEKIEFDISQQQKRIGRAQGVLDQFDEALKRYFDKDYITRGLKERKKQEPERKGLQAEIKDASANIDNLAAEKFKIRKEIRGVEAEVGPLKYIAELLYGEEEAKKHLDKSVRLIIIILIFVFDPLAVLLVIAGNISLAKLRKPNDSTEQIISDKHTPDLISNYDLDEFKNLPPAPPPPALPDAEEKTPMNSTQEGFPTEQAGSSVKNLTPQEQHPDISHSSKKVTTTNPNWKDRILKSELDEAIDELLLNNSLSFNMSGPEGRQLKEQLKKILQKKREEGSS